MPYQFLDELFDQRKGDDMKVKGIIIYYNQNKEEIKRVSLLKAPFKEEVIKEKSIELYNEGEPCIIYITACTNKLGLAMADYISSSNIGKDVMFDVSEAGFYSDIEFPSDVKYISFI